MAATSTHHAGAETELGVIHSTLVVRDDESVGETEDPADAPSGNYRPGE
jgi:hypothetical protein